MRGHLWYKVSVASVSHPKWARIINKRRRYRAFTAWHACLAYAKTHRTGGTVVPACCHGAGMTLAEFRHAAADLVEAGFLRPCQDGATFEIHDYAEHQDVNAEKRSAKARKAAQVRWAKRDASSISNGAASSTANEHHARVEKSRVEHTRASETGTSTVVEESDFDALTRRVLTLAGERYEPKRGVKLNRNYNWQGARDLAEQAHHEASKSGAEFDAVICTVLDRWYASSEDWIVKRDWRLQSVADQFPRWFKPPKQTQELPAAETFPDHIDPCTGKPWGEAEC